MGIFGNGESGISSVQTVRPDFGEIMRKRKREELIKSDEEMVYELIKQAGLDGIYPKSVVSPITHLFLKHVDGLVAIKSGKIPDWID